MRSLPLVTDCEACRGVGTVIFGACCVCFAEFFEDDDGFQRWEASEPGPSGPIADRLPSAVVRPVI